MKNYSAKINGKTILYQDSIVCTITTSLSLWQRIKILFGCKVVTNVQVFTRQPVNAVGEQILTTVIRLPKKKKQNGQPTKN